MVDVAERGRQSQQRAPAAATASLAPSASVKSPEWYEGDERVAQVGGEGACAFGEAPHPGFARAGNQDPAVGSRRWELVPLTPLGQSRARPPGGMPPAQAGT